MHGKVIPLEENDEWLIDILNETSDQSKHSPNLNSPSHAAFAEHFEQLGNKIIPENDILGQEKDIQMSITYFPCTVLKILFCTVVDFRKAFDNVTRSRKRGLKSM